MRVKEKTFRGGLLKKIGAPSGEKINGGHLQNKLADGGKVYKGGWGGQERNNLLKVNKTRQKNTGGGGGVGGWTHQIVRGGNWGTPKEKNSYERGFERMGGGVGAHPRPCHQKHPKKNPGFPSENVAKGGGFTHWTNKKSENHPPKGNGKSRTSHCGGLWWEKKSPPQNVKKKKT